MIAGIVAEMIKSLRYKKNHKILAVMSIVPPMAMSLFFIQAFSFTSGGGFPMVVVNNDTTNMDNWTNNFIASLDSDNGTIPYFDVKVTDEATAQRMFDLRETFIIVYISADFSTKLTEGKFVRIEALINNIHEDLSKNLRLGLETRIYEFSVNFQLETGSKPGLVIDKSTVYQKELPRPEYMISGVLIFSIMFFSFLDGALLGSSEKEEGTDREIEMASNGVIMASSGKILATLIASSINTFLLLAFTYIAYGPYFTSLMSVLVFLAVFFCIATTFGIAGVHYGMKVGDMRAIPGPTAFVTATIWMVGGAINPLEFSAGAQVFKFLPNAAAVRILTAAVFDRGQQYVTEAWTILGSWLILVVFLTLLKFMRIRS